MDALMKVGLLSLGGALGVNARYWLGLGIARVTHEGFPWATLVINVSGAFAIGLLSPLFVSSGSNQGLRLLVVTGFLGGYTTFSAFSLEAFDLWRGDGVGRSLIYMVGSLTAGMAAVALGAALGHKLMPPTGPQTASLIERMEPEDVRGTADDRAS